MFENQRGMLPLMLGLGILQANQPSRAPVRFGGVLGQGLASGFGNYLQMQQQAQAAEREKRKEERDKQMFELQVQRLNAQLEAKKQRDNYLRSITTPSDGIGPVRQQRDGRDAAEALRYGLDPSDVKLIQGSPVKPPESRVINLPDGREQRQEFIDGQWVNVGPSAPRWQPKTPDNSPPQTRETRRDDGKTYRQVWDGKASEWKDTGESWPTYQPERGLTADKISRVQAARMALKQFKIDWNAPPTEEAKTLFAIQPNLGAAHQLAQTRIPEDDELDIKRLEQAERDEEEFQKYRKSSKGKFQYQQDLAGLGKTNELKALPDGSTYEVTENLSPDFPKGSKIKILRQAMPKGFVIQNVENRKTATWVP